MQNTTFIYCSNVNTIIQFPFSLYLMFTTFLHSTGYRLSIGTLYFVILGGLAILPLLNRSCLFYNYNVKNYLQFHIILSPNCRLNVHIKLKFHYPMFHITLLKYLVYIYLFSVWARAHLKTIRSGQSSSSVFFLN